ncbi:hypothetical protein KC19_11G124100 [Ceratodon purpureus]|uniref:Uncharacterized protein n=1 Tax=Ceratodon purpureus TaxID=3225 RepID=A0A8T0GEA7_CERPU|nr:hypothetical protein KC19_11G124100 [Ceratodon purpureus]
MQIPFPDDMATYFPGFEATGPGWWEHVRDGSDAHQAAMADEADPVKIQANPLRELRHRCSRSRHGDQKDHCQASGIRMFPESQDVLLPTQRYLQSPWLDLRSLCTSTASQSMVMIIDI